MPPIEGFLVGQHPLVVRLMKGIQNSRPAMPRYQHCWDVNKVLDYIKSLPANENLSLDMLIGKLATLMAITAPKHSSELGLLDFNFSKRHPQGITFSLPGRLKLPLRYALFSLLAFPVLMQYVSLPLLMLIYIEQHKHENTCHLTLRFQIHFSSPITCLINRSSLVPLPNGSKSLSGLLA